MMKTMFGLKAVVELLELEPSSAAACLVRRPAIRPTANTTLEENITINEMRIHLFREALGEGAGCAACWSVEFSGGLAPKSCAEVPYLTMAACLNNLTVVRPRRVDQQADLKMKMCSGRSW